MFGEHVELFSSAVLMAAGAYGMWRRRRTAVSLYLDARVWWKRNVQTSLVKDATTTGGATPYDTRVVRFADGKPEEEDARVAALQDDRSGQPLRAWFAEDSARMLAVGADAPFPASAEEVGEFQRAECPFVLITYVNSAGSECRLNVDPELWYRRSGLGVPKFTRAEVRFLHSRCCSGSSSSAAAWTDEYTVECMTADGREVVLTQDQVFWSGPRTKPESAAAAVVAETTTTETPPQAAAAEHSECSDDSTEMRCAMNGRPVSPTSALRILSGLTPPENGLDILTPGADAAASEDDFIMEETDTVAVASSSSRSGRSRSSSDDDDLYDVRDRKRRRRAAADQEEEEDAPVVAHYSAEEESEDEE